ncbi:MAG: TatD family deoxyribonuclease [Gammaproteobacteria bacterium]|nr:MAG: TatD family deoxyribonuclease [Gammaproteobacteria bacterium]
MLIDSHCHLDKVDTAPFGGSVASVLDAAAEQGVGGFLNVCIDLEHFADVHDIALADERVWCSVGVHPTHTEGEEPTVERLCALGSQDRVIAIGETGLDYYRIEGEGADWQRERFRTHIRAAIELDKPLIIHTRSARDDTLRILREEGAHRCRGIMHCFAEDWETASRAMDLGFVISFSGIITFKNAEELRDVARRVPEDMMLVETDSPWLAPVPYRGKPNHPALVRHVAEKLAEVRGVEPEVIAERTTRNFRELFQLG